MWICLNNAFLSIVSQPGDAGALLVRARVRGHIEAVFGDVPVIRLPGRDYLWRAVIPRETVADVISKNLLSISYGNFKNSVRDDRLHDAYASVWGVMARLQEVRPYASQAEADLFNAPALTSSPPRRPPPAPRRRNPSLPPC